MARVAGRDRVQERFDDDLNIGRPVKIINAGGQEWRKHLAHVGARFVVRPWGGRAWPAAMAAAGNSVAQATPMRIGVPKPVARRPARVAKAA
jgi:hypothetical protein